VFTARHSITKHALLLRGGCWKFTLQLIINSMPAEHAILVACQCIVLCANVIIPRHPIFLNFIQIYAPVGYKAICMQNCSLMHKLLYSRAGASLKRGKLDKLTTSTMRIVSIKRDEFEIDDILFYVLCFVKIRLFVT